MWEHRTFDSKIFPCSKVTTLTPLSLLVSCKLSFPSVSEIAIIYTVANLLKARTVKPAETAIARERLYKHACC
jgi:hypothetical protein